MRGRLFVNTGTGGVMVNILSTVVANNPSLRIISYNTQIVSL